ncbi:MAG TPA: hypothetical protein VIK76_03230, partial [Pyrinomonadaceae bacterium]
TVMFTYNAKEIAKLGKVFVEMEREAANVLRSEGFARSRQRHERSLAMRYRGQSFELEVRDTTGDLEAAFHRAHRERYGYAQEQSEIEIVSARVRSFGIVEKLAQRKIKSGKNRALGIYKRDELGAGAKLKTPCIVTEYSATTLIDADSKARIDDFGNIVITV